MWPEITKYLRRFDSAVLTGRDAEGYPFSVRCTPRPDDTARVLRVEVPDYSGIVPGPVGLLCHSHDAQLATLRGFNVRGVLERDAEGWLMRPTQFIPGMGIGGPLTTLKAMREIARSANGYFARRGLPRPAVPWAEINAAKAAAKAAKAKA